MVALMARDRVQPIDGYAGEARVPLNAWMMEADRLIWSDCAQCQRVAGAIIIEHRQNLTRSAAMSLAYRRASLANAEGEIAKARALARFIVEPDKRARARKAINKMAACVRSERGV